MAIGIICPKVTKQSKSIGNGVHRKSRCGTRNPLGNKNCRRCGYNFKKGKLEYYIEYREQGKRKYEYMGPSKQAAEIRIAEIKKKLVEGRTIKRDSASSTKLGDLIQWYEGLESVKAKKSYARDVQLLSVIQRIIGKEKRIN